MQEVVVSPVAFWRGGSAVSSLARLKVLSRACQGRRCIVCTCVYVCARMLVFVEWSSTMPLHPIGVCLCGCVPACVCLPMCAVRRKWLCLFKLSTLSHVGQFSGNESPAPPRLPSPFPKPAPLSFPHPAPKPSEWAAVF